MPRPKTLPLVEEWTDPDAYVDALLSFATSSDLFRHLCGGVHNLDFLTREPDVYTSLLPEHWRAFFELHDLQDLLDLFLREDLQPLLDQSRNPATDEGNPNARQEWRGAPLPPTDLLEYLQQIRRLSLGRDFRPPQPGKPTIPKHIAVGMNVKKYHEVAHFSRYVDSLCATVDGQRGDNTTPLLPRPRPRISPLQLHIYSKPSTRIPIKPPIMATTFSLPPLPYAYDALEPVICKQIMEIHHQKHHQTYITNLNAALSAQSTALAANNIPQLINLQQKIKFNGGGHINHSLFWKNLAPHASPETNIDQAAPVLKAAIEAQYGSIEKFKEAFGATLLGLQGSGWGWLVANGPGGKLEIVSTKDQDPVTDKVPVFGVDMWEHAYYLQYFNNKASYVEGIWKVLNWRTAEDRFKNGVEGSALLKL